MRTRAGSTRDQFQHDISTTCSPVEALRNSSLFQIVSSWFGLPQVLRGHMSTAGQSLVEADAMVLQLDATGRSWLLSNLTIPTHPNTPQRAPDCQTRS